MADVSVTVEGLERLKAGLTGVQLADFWRRVHTAFALLEVRNFAIRVPQRWSTGSKTLLYKADTDSVELHTAVSALRFVEFGTRPHIIRPVRAKALAWKAGPGAPAERVTAVTRTRHYITGAPLKTPVTTGMVFAGAVRHPGTQAMHYLENTIRASAAIFTTKMLPNMIVQTMTNAGIMPAVEGGAA